MGWELRIKYSDGKEQALRSYKNREVALKQIDAIYAQGYPMHVAYIIRPAPSLNSPPTTSTIGNQTQST